jgi:hypothetical protein
VSALEIFKIVFRAIQVILSPQALPMRRISILLMAAFCAASHAAFAGGVVTNCTEADFQKALAGGGMIVFQCDGILTLTNTIPITNSVTLEATGHGVKISGGGLVRLFNVSSNAAFSAKHLTFADGADIRTNEVLEGKAFPARGGAILSIGGNINLVDCILTNNTIKGGDARRFGNAPFPESADPAFGGAIYISGGNLMLSNCVLAANAAQGGGAAGMAGTAKGGAVYIEGATGTISESSMERNISQGGEAFDAVGGRGPGGDSEGAAIYSTNATLTIRMTKFEANAASGGKADWAATAGTGRGGAIRIANGSRVLVDTCRFMTNQAFGGGVPRFAYGGDGLGGAIAASADVTITDSTFSSNLSRGGRSFSPGLGAGGAVWSTNNIVLSGCTFDQNLANGGDAYTMPVGDDDPSVEENIGKGGALALSGQASLTNCTVVENHVSGGNNASIISSNPAEGLGGGIYMENCDATLEHLTLALNTAWTGSTFSSTKMPGFGAGILVTNIAGLSNKIVNLANSIFAWNTNGNIGGAVSDQGYNISSDSTPAWSSPESRNNIDPLLEVLSDNGGPTLTMALLAGSPARDIIPSDTTSVDQRRVARPQGPAFDSGAFEADYVASAPVFLRQPGGAEIRVGGTRTFTAVAGGSAPLSYIWRKDGVPIAAPNSASLTLTNLQPTDAGSYTLVVSNGLGSAVSNPAILIVDAMPVILTQPQSVVSAPGVAVDFSATADGPSLAYQWWHNSGPIVGATNSLLHISSAAGGDQGEYFVVVSNFAGNVTSSIATLAFDESALKILTQPQAQSVEQGNSVSFSVLVSGVPPISYQWVKDGSSIEGAVQQKFTIPKAELQDAGEYSVIVSNDYRVATSKTAQLTVLNAPASPHLTISRVSTQGPAVAITFSVEASRSYTLLQSTNLTDWTVWGSKTAGTTGSFQFILDISDQPSIFFRIASP